MKKVLLYSLLLLVGITSFSSCSDDDDNNKDYRYIISIDGLEYSGSLFGPLPYLESLQIRSDLTLNSSSQKDADTRAIAVFDTEMGKIDVDALEEYRPYYVRYILKSVYDNRVVREKEFGEKR